MNVVTLVIGAGAVVIVIGVPAHGAVGIAAHLAAWFLICVCIVKAAYLDATVEAK